MTTTVNRSQSHLGFIDLNKNELRNAAIQNLGAAPGTPGSGQVWYLTTDNRLHVYANATDRYVLTDQDIVVGSTSITKTGLAFSVTDGAITGGTAGAGVKIAASTITAANVAAANIDGTTGTASLRTLGNGAQQALAGNQSLAQIAAANASVSGITMSSQRVLGVADCISAQDAATKNYVDNTGTNTRLNSAKAASLANVASLSGPQTVDGVSLVAGERVLLTAQTTASQNGLWSVAAGAWLRPNDFVAGADVRGALIAVSGGTVGTGGLWEVTGSTVVTVDTTAMVLQRIDQGYIAGSGSIVKTGGVLTVADASITGGVAGAGVKLAAATITDANVAAANKDGVVGLASLRTIGTGAQQAMAGNTTLATIAAPAGPVALNAQKITGLADPTNPQDAATKNYVDSTINGVDWKASARAATAAALPANTGTTGVLTASGVGVLTVDGVALVLNDRVLVKNEATGANNGLYYVSTAGTASVAYVLTRTTDAATSAQVTPGMAVFVEEGTANGNQQWVLTTDAPITLNTTTLVFAQIGAQGGAPAAGNGLTLVSNTYDVVPAAGGGITVAADSISVDPAIVARKYTATFGDGSALAYVMNHALANQYVQVQVCRATTPWDTIDVDVERTDANNVTIRCAVAPTAAQYRVIVNG